MNPASESVVHRANPRSGTNTMSHWFARNSSRIASLAGNYRSFVVAVLIICIWLFTGPLFGFSDTWQLVINTGTTIVTFLMVFLIQNTQNRDSLAVHLKLDELIRAVAEADNEIIEAEDDTDEELAELKRYYRKLAEDQVLIRQKIDQAIEAKKIYESNLHPH